MCFLFGILNSIYLFVLIPLIAYFLENFGAQLSLSIRIPSFVYFVGLSCRNLGFLKMISLRIIFLVSNKINSHSQVYKGVVSRFRIFFLWRIMIVGL